MSGGCQDLDMKQTEVESLQDSFCLFTGVVLSALVSSLMGQHPGLIAFSGQMEGLCQTLVGHQLLP